MAAFDAGYPGENEARKRFCTANAKRRTDLAIFAAVLALTGCGDLPRDSVASIDGVASPAAKAGVKKSKMGLSTAGSFLA